MKKQRKIQNLINKKLRKKAAIFLLVCFCFGFFPLISSAREAGQMATEKNTTLYLQNINQNKNSIAMDIVVDPHGQAINAVGAYMNFPANKLQGVSFVTTNSFCELFIEREFDNSAGGLKFSCGKPYPGINTKAVVARLVFKKKSAGWVELRFTEDTQILANDGYGTDVLANAKDDKFLLK